MPKWEPACRLRALRPSVTHGWATPAKIRKKCCFGRGRIWVNIAVRPCLHSSLTHHRNIENKVWEICIFIKECTRSLLKSSLPVNDVSACKCIFVYIHVHLYCGYTTLIVRGYVRISSAHTKPDVLTASKICRCCFVRVSCKIGASDFILGFILVDFLLKVCHHLFCFLINALMEL